MLVDRTTVARRSTAVDAHSILVVEDGSTWGLPVMELLQSNQYRLIHVRDGRSALDRAAEDPPDVVLAQDNLPELDGYTLCRRIRGRPPTATTRVILMLSNNAPDDRVDALKVGADGYLGPPFDQVEVIAKIEAELREKAAIDELRKSNAALRMATENLKRAAITDSLTALYNRGYFDQVCEREFHRAKRFGLELSCVLTDIDDFKELNDTYGHQAGDLVLVTYARLLKNNIRNIDIAARYGGEEFALLLPNTDYEGGWTVAEKIRHEAESHLSVISGKKPDVTASFGVASFGGSHAETPEQFVRCADAALYLAKKNGRNRVEVYLPEDLTEAAEEQPEEEKAAKPKRAQSPRKRKAR